MIFVSADFAIAAETGQAPGAACTCPESKPQKPKFAGLAPQPLDDTDEVAALESVQYALTEVADGSSYVWHRSNGRLSGIIKPVASFKDKQGDVCRRALVVLNSASTTKKIEVTGCRLPDGVWQLNG